MVGSPQPHSDGSNSSNSSSSNASPSTTSTSSSGKSSTAAAPQPSQSVKVHTVEPIGGPGPPPLSSSTSVLKPLETSSWSTFANASSSSPPSTKPSKVFNSSPIKSAMSEPPVVVKSETTISTTKIRGSDSSSSSDKKSPVLQVKPTVTVIPKPHLSPIHSDSSSSTGSSLSTPNNPATSTISIQHKSAPTKVEANSRPVPTPFREQVTAQQKSVKIQRENDNAYQQQQRPREISTLENPSIYCGKTELLQGTLFNMTDYNERLKETRMLLFGELIQYPPPPPECHCKEVWEEMEKNHVTNCECGMENCGCECCGCDVKMKPPTIVDREELNEKIQRRKNSKDRGITKGLHQDHRHDKTQKKMVGQVEVETITTPTPLLEMPILEPGTSTGVRWDINNNLVRREEKKDELGDEKFIREMKKIQFQLPTERGRLLLSKNETICYVAKSGKSNPASPAAGNVGSTNSKINLNVQSGAMSNAARGANTNANKNRGNNRRGRPRGSASSGGGRSSSRNRKRSGYRRRQKSGGQCKPARSCCCCEDESESSSSSDEDSDGCCEFPSQFLWFILQMNSTAQYYKQQVAYQSYFQQQLQDQPAIEDECDEDTTDAEGIVEESHANQGNMGNKQSNVKRINISSLEDIIGREGENALLNKEVAITLKPFNPNTADGIPDNPLIDMKSLRLFAHGEREQAECCCDTNNDSCCGGEGTNGRGCCGMKKGDSGGNDGEGKRCCPNAPPQPPCCQRPCAQQQPLPQCTYPCAGTCNLSTPVCQVPLATQPPYCYPPSPPPTPYPCYPGYPPPFPYCYSPPVSPFSPYSMPFMPSPMMPCYPPFPFLPPWALGGCMMGMNAAAAGLFGGGLGGWDGSGNNEYWNENEGTPSLENGQSGFEGGAGEGTGDRNTAYYGGDGGKTASRNGGSGYGGYDSGNGQNGYGNGNGRGNGANGGDGHNTIVNFGGNQSNQNEKGGANKTGSSAANINLKFVRGESK